MIVVTNRIPVAEGHEADFEDRFKHRVHLVDRAPGFIRNEVHRPRPMKLDHATGEMLREHLLELEEHVHVIDHYLQDDTLVQS